MLEVIAMSVEDARAAQAGGAGRLELCANLLEGGTTPSYGVIKRVIQAVDIPVFVMLRPHGDGFYYSFEDRLVMAEDAVLLKALGAKGVVLGALTDANKIDHQFLQEILPYCGGLEITFHRAFDLVEDQLAAFEELKQYPAITRILTSAGEGTAIGNKEQLEKLVAAAEQSHITILAGSGVNEGNSAELLKTGVKELHVGSAVRVDESFKKPIISEKIRQIIQIL